MAISHRQQDHFSDTRMMNLVHAALRRDLERARIVLAPATAPDAARLRAVARHLCWLADFLRTHHRIEDEHLFPAVRTARPDVAALLDLMDAEHGRIAPALRDVEGRAARVDTDARTGARGQRELHDAVTALQEVLALHLYDEETRLLPIVEATLTEPEWQAYDRQNLRRSIRELAFIGHWLLDALNDEQDRQKVSAQVPPIAAWVLIRLLGGAYRRHWAATWQDTPAREVPSAPLPRLPRPLSQASTRRDGVAEARFLALRCAACFVSGPALWGRFLALRCAACFVSGPGAGG